MNISMGYKKGFSWKERRIFFFFFRIFWTRSSDVLLYYTLQASYLTLRMAFERWSFGYFMKSSGLGFGLILYVTTFFSFFLFFFSTAKYTEKSFDFLFARANCPFAWFRKFLSWKIVVFLKTIYHLSTMLLHYFWCIWWEFLWTRK